MRIKFPEPFEVGKSGKKVNEKLIFMIFLKKSLHTTVAAPLIAALDYWPLLNRGRKNRGLSDIFY